MAPRTRLWLLLLGSCGFVALGALISPSDWRLGVGCAGFFGACALVFAWQLRALGDDGAPALLDLRGGKTLTPSRTQRVLFLLVGLAAGGASMLVGYGRNPLLWWLGGAVVLAVLVALVLQALGVPARTAVRFSPEGLHFEGGPAPCLLAFDNLAELQRAEWNGHVLVLLRPVDFGALLLTVPEGQRAAAATAFGQSLSFAQAPLVLWPGRLGVDPGALLRSLERYRREPAARAELRAA